MYEDSGTGTLVYVPGHAAGMRGPVWVDHRGTAPPPVYYLSPRVAPSGSQLSVTVVEEGISVWLLDPLREISRRFTDDQGNEFWQIWTIDGRGVV